MNLYKTSFFKGSIFVGLICLAICAKESDSMDSFKLTKKEKQTVAYYDEHGKEWADEHPLKDTTSFWKTEVDTFSKNLASGKILELGVGAGVDARLLIEKNFEYIGIDVSKTLLSIAEKTNPSGNFVHASLYDLPFQEDEFDGFWAAAVLLHVPKSRIDEAFISLKKVLKRGAYGFISLKAGEQEAVDSKTQRFFSYYSSDEFTKILLKHDFIVEKTYERAEIKRATPCTWLCFFVKYQPTT